MQCRLCLSQMYKNGRLLFEDTEKQAFLEIIMNFLQLGPKLCDDISTMICHECWQHFDDFYKFCKNVEKQQNTLRQQLVAIKTEPDLDIFDVYPSATNTTTAARLPTHCERDPNINTNNSINYAATTVAAITTATDSNEETLVDIKNIIRNVEVDPNPYRNEKYNLKMDVKELICQKFGFPEEIYERIVENGFDMQALEVATESEINDLFTPPLLGVRAKFKHHLNEWKKKAKAVPKITTCRRSLEQNSSDSSESFMQFPFSNVDVKTVLQTNKLGLEIMRAYANKGTLDDVHRGNIISIIVDNYTIHNKTMSMKDIDAVANGIVEIFPTEKKENYIIRRGSGRNPTGPLHDKAVNARQKIKKMQKLLPLDLDKTSTSDVPLTTYTHNEEVVAWLKYNNDPWTEVERNWKLVVDERQDDIKNNSENILLKWPLFKHSLGYKLIDIDYNIAFANNESKLFELWPNFIPKILKYFNDNVKDKASLQLLQKIKNASKDSRDCIIMLILHAILKPPIVSVEHGGKKFKWKPTITEAQESCIVHIKSVLDIHTAIDALKEKYRAKKLTIQPIILVIGEDESSLMFFYIFYNEIFYKFDSFIECLDIHFKLFHVLKFEYPKEGHNIFSFMENMFYNFKTQSNSNVSKLLQAMKK